MNVLTLKIPEELHAALQAASRNRGLSKSAVVREAIEHALGRHAEASGAAERWLAQWRERSLAPPPARKGAKAAQAANATPQDERLAHLLARHVR